MNFFREKIITLFSLGSSVEKIKMGIREWGVGSGQWAIDSGQ